MLTLKQESREVSSLVVLHFTPDFSSYIRSRLSFRLAVSKRRQEVRGPLGSCATGGRSRENGHASRPASRWQSRVTCTSMGPKSGKSWSESVCIQLLVGNCLRHRGTSRIKHQYYVPPLRSTSPNHRIHSRARGFAAFDRMYLRESFPQQIRLRFISMNPPTINTLLLPGRYFSKEFSLCRYAR